MKSPDRYFVPTTVLASRPAASVDMVGLLWQTRETGNHRTKTWQCVQNDDATPAYEWIQTGVSTTKTPKQKMTTFWVSPETWKHVQDQRELGETVDECLRRLMGIRRQGQDLVAAARGYISESLRLHNEENPEGSLTMLREAVLCLVNSLDP